MVAAMYALASCGGQSHAAPSPTIEYRTPPVGVAYGPENTVASRVVGVAHTIPSPPSCTVGCEPPTQTPTATPTPIPIATPAATEVESQEGATIVATSTKWSSLDTTLTAAGWPSSLLPWAEGIIQRESGGDPTVSNYQGSGAAGWFQILPSTWADTGCVGDPFDALDNAVCAWRLYSIAGASPWAVG